MEGSVLSVTTETPKVTSKLAKSSSPSTAKHKLGVYVQEIDGVLTRAQLQPGRMDILRALVNNADFISTQDIVRITKAKSFIIRQNLGRLAKIGWASLEYRPTKYLNKIGYQITQKMVFARLTPDGRVAANSLLARAKGLAPPKPYPAGARKTRCKECKGVYRNVPIYGTVILGRHVRELIASKRLSADAIEKLLYHFKGQDVLGVGNTLVRSNAHLRLTFFAPGKKSIELKSAYRKKDRWQKPKA